MLEKYFQIKQRKTDIRTEVIAGLTTFLTMAYIIVVNPSILAQAGMDKPALIAVTCLVAAVSRPDRTHEQKSIWQHHGNRDL